MTDPPGDPTDEFDLLPQEPAPQSPAPPQPPAPSQPPEPLPPPAPIADELPCIRCGYLLKGLSPQSNCPECGTPIARSIRGDYLQYADPHWVGKLRTGVLVLLLHACLNILLMVAWPVGALALGIVSFRGGVPGLRTIWLIRAGAVATGIALGTVWLTGILLLTSAEPRLRQQEKPATLRRVIILCAVASFIGSVLVQGVALGATSRTALALRLGGGVLSLLGVVAYFGVFIYLRRLARRLPDPGLAKQTGVVMWGFGVSWGVIVLGSIIAVIVAFVSLPLLHMIHHGSSMTATFAPPALLGGTMLSLGCFACVALLGLLVFGIWYLILLIRYTSAFGAAAQQAARSTSAENQ